MKRLLLSLLCLLATACGRDDDPMARHAGRWLVINYWAQWCAPCRDEIPELNAFAQQHGATTTVAAVNFDGITGDELQQQARALGIAFELMETDPASRGHWPRPEVLPTTLIVNPEGKLVRTLTGPQTAAALSQTLAAAQGQ
jgi:thiol-disulfide isomerase/thioredoxin